MGRLSGDENARLEESLRGGERSGCKRSRTAQCVGGGGGSSPHLAKEIARESATPLSSTCIPRGIAAKLTENPSPPVPRPTSSSKLSRKAELAKDLVRGGSTTNVPMLSKLAEPGGVSTSCAPGRCDAIQQGSRRASLQRWWCCAKHVSANNGSSRAVCRAEVTGGGGTASGLWQRDYRAALRRASDRRERVHRSQESDHHPRGLLAPRILK
eukprot:scaffold26940_cov117-Phaeocystis_antarctica.AAC.23